MPCRRRLLQSLLFCYYRVHVFGLFFFCSLKFIMFTMLNVICAINFYFFPACNSKPLAREFFHFMVTIGDPAEQNFACLQIGLMLSKSPLRNDDETRVRHFVRAPH